jgi:hypothetical protein
MFFSYLSRFVAVLCTGLFSACAALSQGLLGTEQPFESASALVVPLGATQIEAGGWLQWATPEGEQVEDFTYAVPLGIIRYGFRERVEVRVGAQFSQSLGQAETARAGIKWDIVPDADRFRVAWISEIETRLNSISTNTRAPSQHRMCAAWTDEDRWSARANWGVRWGADSTEMIVAAAAAREVGWQGWTVFLEPVWRSTTGVRVHAGALLEVGDDAQVDIAFQRDLDTGDLRFTFGYSRRLWRTEETAQPEP